MITSAEDWDWLADVCQNDEVLSGPAQLSVGLPTKGGVIAVPHVLAVGRAAIAMRGEIPQLVQLRPPPAVTQWCAKSLFDDRVIRPHELSTLDGLHRWCEGLASPSVVKCPRCDGSGYEPGASRDAEGFIMACRRCDGDGELEQRADGYTDVGSVTVDRRDLLPMLPHLRGEVVGIFLLPSADHLGMDVQIRGGGQHTTDWRIVLSAVRRKARQLVKVAS